MISICIDKNVEAPELVIKHEMVHAQQFCNQRHVFAILKPQCVPWEKEAYAVSCRIAQDQRRLPPGITLELCIKCGVFLSCGQYGSVRSPGPWCNDAAIGMSRLPPQPAQQPFPNPNM